MFIDPDQFPFLAHLELNWNVIRDEFLGLSQEQLLAWPERDLYASGWDVFGLWAIGQKLTENCSFCPVTTAAVESIPGLTTAGFSQLAPGARIRPHVGYTDSVLRAHLGLVVPPHCALQVGDEVRHWEAGKLLVFDDTTPHSAWNDSAEPRIVLLIDFLRPGRTFDPTVSDEVARAIQSQLPPRSGS